MVVIASLRSLGISSPDQKKKTKKSQKKTQLDEVFEKNTQMHGELEGTTHRFLGKKCAIQPFGEDSPNLRHGKKRDRYN